MLIQHEIEMKNKVETIIRDFIKELHSTVHTEVDSFYSTENEIKGPAEMIELIKQSSFFNTSHNEEEIIESLNNQILDKNITEDNDKEDVEFDDSLKYFNYLFLSDPNDSTDSREKILFLFTFQGFENNIIENYKSGASYSFLKYLLNEIFRELRSGKISSILDEVIYKNKADTLSVLVRQFTENLVRIVCSSDSNNLFNELYYISSLSYEGASISAKLMVLNEENMDTFVDFYIKLGKKIKYKEHRKIRKLLEISDDIMYLIGDDQYVYGIGKARRFGEIKELEKEKNILVIDFIGKFEYSLNTVSISKEIIRQSDEYFEDVRWSWNEINCVQITYGKPSLQENLFSIEILTSELKKSFYGYFREKKYNKTNINDRISKIINIVEYATKQKHGTMLVIAKPKLAIAEIERLEAQSIKVMKTDLLKQGKKEGSNNIIERITSIDGALYLDIEGYCYAMGVILDGIAEKGKGDTSRGARYNSAIKYYNMDGIKENCVIVIISEDGMVDIISDTQKGVKEVNSLKNEIKSLIRDENFNEALNKAEQLLEFDDPTVKADAYFFKAFLLLETEGANDNGINLCIEAIKMDDNHIPSHLLLGHMYGKLNNYSKSIDIFNKVIEMDPKRKVAYNNRAIQYINKGDYGKAIDDYTKAIDIDENYALAYNNRAKAYMQKENYEKAIDDYYRAIKLDNSLPNSYNSMNKAYNELIKLYPDKEGTYKAKLEEIKSLLGK
ncbi:tetratricopeptide repeat protein [Priestia megaterium]